MTDIRKDPEDELIEQKLYNAVAKATPDVWGKIVLECGFEQEKVIYMNKDSKIKKSKIFSGAVAAAIALVAGVSGVNIYSTTYAVDAVIGIDVNPSIELMVNSKEKVIDIKALNEDAEKAMVGMNLKNANLNVALNAVVGAMVSSGYINDNANSVLISVETNNEQKAKSLREKISSDVEIFVAEREEDIAILTQTVNPNTELKSLAKTNNISLGKAKLITELVSEDSLLKFDDLSKMSVNDLNILAREKKSSVKNNNISVSGNVSTKSYIGKESAYEIALEDASLSYSYVKNLKVELDSENGKMKYEVEFIYNSKEYEYDIDALSGNILDKKIKEEIDDDKQLDNNGNDKGTQVGSNANPNSYLTKDKALSKIYKHADISNSQVSNIYIELKHEDGVPMYEIEFYANDYEYDYLINAVNGNIIKYDTKAEIYPNNSKDKDKDNDKEKNAKLKVNLTETKALESAYKHANVIVSKVYDVKIELDEEDGIPIFEIEFYYNNYEYDYIINATNGNIIKYETETESNKSNGNPNKDKDKDLDDDNAENSNKPDNKSPNKNKDK